MEREVIAVIDLDVSEAEELAKIVAKAKAEGAFLHIEVVKVTI